MRKLKEQGGFSLVESLAVIIVVLLLSTCIASGTRLATESFARSVSASEAEVLGSTLKTVISEELRTTETIEVKNGKVTGIFSKNYGLGESGEMSAFGAVDSFDSPDTKGEITLGGKKLLSSAAYTYGYQASVDYITYKEPSADSYACYYAKLTMYDRNGRKVKTYNFDVMPIVAPTVKW